MNATVPGGRCCLSQNSGEEEARPLGTSQLKNGRSVCYFVGQSVSKSGGSPEVSQSVSQSIRQSVNELPP